MTVTATYRRDVPGPTLETQRLVLRPLGTDDLAELAALHGQESFWKYPLGRGLSEEETRTFLDRVIAGYSDPGIGVHAIVVRETDELAGWAGLSVPTFLPEILPAVEAGWRLGEQHRGRGYATEAGLAWLRHGFEHLDLDRIVSIYEPANAASGVVMRKLGFSPDLVTTHPVHGVEIHVMSLRREAWQRRAQP